MPKPTQRVAAGEQVAGPGEGGEYAVESAGQRIPVAAAHGGGELGAGARDPGAVAEGAGRQLAGQVVGSGAGEGRGEHVREVADAGHRAVVLVGGGRYDPAAQPGDQPRHGEPVRQRRAVLQAQDPGGPVEQVRIARLEPRPLGAGHRVAADIPQVRPVRAHHVPRRDLHAGHVGDQRTRAVRRDRLDQVREGG
jgi:hypothetical protein